MEIWIIGIGILLCTSLCATSVILTSARKGRSPLDQILIRQDKIDALIESAELWVLMGLAHEADACISEVKRLNAEMLSIMSGESP
jgi:hypothetical protein